MVRCSNIYCPFIVEDDYKSSFCDIDFPCYEDGLPPVYPCDNCDHLVVEDKIMTYCSLSYCINK